GLRPLVKSKCDALVKIPLHGKVGSLNASVAAGVMLFEAARQRMIKSNH
ncbi:MAG TPA: TrmH family RNA methyltransferase, partial [Candidatus Kapabacteria bacterium]|nr:TrmH family RNA methyltransferase [Candidatus Kapabacteria bacterium]